MMKKLFDNNLNENDYDNDIMEDLANQYVSNINHYLIEH